LGIWVVLPDPVSPETITTWWSRMAAAISARRAETGSSSGYVMVGTEAALAASWAGVRRPTRALRSLAREVAPSDETCSDM